MTRAHPFRFKRRRRKDGRVYVVVYDHEPGREVSTGVPVHRDDTATGGPGYDEAVSWAYANLSSRPLHITVREATAEMFTATCTWRRRVTAKGRRFSSTYFSLHRSRLVHYVWPRWGAYEPQQIRPAQIDEWLLDLQSTTTGKALSPEMKNKVLQTMRKTLDELEYQGILEQGHNPARLVAYYTDREKKRRPITMDEFHKLFPEDQDELVRIWGTLRWAAFFYVMATTGMRPGEVAAMDLAYWIKGVGYPVSQAIDPDTREIKGLKTSEAGVTVKPAYFNDRAEALLTMLVYQGSPQSGLLFAGMDGRGMPPETANKHFKASCVRAGVELGGRTQYSLRHFYSTTIAAHLTEEQAAAYLGQRTYRGEYDHRKVVEKLKGDEDMRRLSNRVF